MKPLIEVGLTKMYPFCVKLDWIVNCVDESQVQIHVKDSLVSVDLVFETYTTEYQI